MNILKYTNKTNPTAPIMGLAVLTDEELSTLNTNIEIVKTKMNEGKKFLFRVGENGCIITDTVEGLNYEILTVDYELGDSGFARWFVDGVLVLTEDSFIESQPIIEPVIEPQV